MVGLVPCRGSGTQTGGIDFRQEHEQTGGVWNSCSLRDSPLALLWQIMSDGITFGIPQSANRLFLGDRLFGGRSRAHEVRLDHGVERWLEPFLSRLAHKARRRICPLYIAGLIGPGERKGFQPMAIHVT